MEMENTKRVNVYAVEIEFGDCDPAGIVYFPNYFHWIDSSTRHYFRSLGVPPWRDLVKTTGITGTPLVDTKARFLRSAVYGEKIEVHTWIDEWRDKSFVFKHEIRRGQEVLVECTEVRVFAIQHPEDPNRIKAIQTPDHIKSLCYEEA